jgi:dihydroorotase-like cyclic amidohydrolase
MEVRGVNVMTFLDGKVVFEAEEKKKNETAVL